VKKRSGPNRSKKTDALNRRLSEIENTLHKIESQVIETKDSREKIENTLRKIEEHVIKDSKEKIENILVELAEVKQHVAKTNKRQPRGQRTSRLARKRRHKDEADIQTTFEENLTPGEETDKKDNSLGGLVDSVDFEQIIKLLQNPVLQSMLKSIL
jgi:chromosome segregation ATPase